MMAIMAVAAMFISCGNDDNDEPDAPAGNDYAAELTGKWMSCKDIVLFSEEGGTNEVFDYNAYTYTYLDITVDEENPSNGIIIDYLSNSGNSEKKVFCTVSGNKIMTDGVLMGTVETCSHDGDWNDLVIVWEKKRPEDTRVKSYYMYVK